MKTQKKTNVEMGEWLKGGDDEGKPYSDNGHYICAMSVCMIDACNLVCIHMEKDSVATQLIKELNIDVSQHFKIADDALLFLCNLIRLIDSGMLDYDELIEHINIDHCGGKMPSAARETYSQIIEAVRVNFAGTVWTMPYQSAKINPAN